MNRPNLHFKLWVVLFLFHRRNEVKKKAVRIPLKWSIIKVTWCVLCIEALNDLQMAIEIDLKRKNNNNNNNNGTELIRVANKELESIHLLRRWVSAGLRALAALCGVWMHAFKWKINCSLLLQILFNFRVGHEQVMVCARTLQLHYKIGYIIWN